jgi:hypothetical protein
MEIGQSPNWGCSAKGKNNYVLFKKKQSITNRTQKEIPSELN